MPNCSVADCGNWRRKKTHLSEVIYHNYPKDNDLAKVWLSKTKRADKFNIKNATICSQHFLTNDYQRDLRVELLGEKLKPGAIPSIFINRLEETRLNNSTVGRAERLMVRKKVK